MIARGGTQPVRRTRGRLDQRLAIVFKHLTLRNTLAGNEALRPLSLGVVEQDRVCLLAVAAAACHGQPCP